MLFRLNHALKAWMLRSRVPTAVAPWLLLGEAPAVLFRRESARRFPSPCLHLLGGFLLP